MALTDAEKATAKQMAMLGHGNRSIALKLGRKTREVYAFLRDDSANKRCTCGAKLSVRNVTGMCLPCGNRARSSDPDFIAKQRAGMSRKWADPAYRAKMRVTSRAHALRLAQDPAIQEARRQLGKATYKQRLFDPEVRARTMQAVRERSGKTQSANRIAWCPPEYRDQYWFLRRTKRMSLAECKEIIAGEIRAKQQRERAAIERLSPFEKQDRALRNGAGIVANDQRPSLDRPGIYEERKAG